MPQGRRSAAADWLCEDEDGIDEGVEEAAPPQSIASKRRCRHYAAGIFLTSCCLDNEQILTEEKGGKRPLPQIPTRKSTIFSLQIQSNFLFPVTETGVVPTKDGLQRFIQNEIIVATLNTNFQPGFPSDSLPSEAWAIILGNPQRRDPLETCGDAVMNLVMTLILIQRLKSLVNGLSIRKVSRLLSSSDSRY